MIASGKEDGKMWMFTMVGESEFTGTLARNRTPPHSSQYIE